MFDYLLEACWLWQFWLIIPCLLVAFVLACTAWMFWSPKRQTAECLICVFGGIVCIGATWMTGWLTMCRVCGWV